MKKVGQIGVRDVDGLRIIFYDCRSVYVRTTFGNWVVFHRWFVKKRNFYSHNFAPFLKALKNYRHLTMGKITQLAIESDIEIMSAREPDLTGKDWRQLPSKGRKENKE